MYNPFRPPQNKIVCEHCSYAVVEPFPKNCICPKCGKFSTNIFDAFNESNTNPL